MADVKPKFDPSQPFDVAQSKPKFDPNQAYEVATPKTEEIPTVLDVGSDIPAWQRLAVKNLGGSVEDQISFLKKHSPELDISAIGGEIVARKPGEPAYKKLDPSWKTLNPLEWAQDITDVGYDLGSGAASTVAGGLAGAYSAVPTLGIGAVPSAMAASGATSAGLEALRQKIGQAAGTVGEFDPTDVKIAGGLGALGPLLFGSGASKNAIKGVVSKPDVAGKILKSANQDFIEKGAKATADQFSNAADIVASSQRGVLSRTADVLLPMFGGGVPKETLQNATKDVSKTMVSDLVEGGLKIDPNAPHTAQEIGLALKAQGGLNHFGEVGANTFKEVTNEVSDVLGSKYAEGLDAIGVKIDVTDAQKILENVIKDTSKSKNPATVAKGEAAKDVLSRYFVPVEKKSGFEIKPLDLIDQYGNKIVQREKRVGSRSAEKFEVSAKEAQDLTNALSSFIDFSKSPLALDKKDAAERQLRDTVIQARKTITDQVNNQLDNQELNLPDNLRSLYKQSKDFTREIAPKFKDTDRAAKTLENLNAQSNARLREKILKFQEYAKQVTGKEYNLVDIANVADVTKWLGDPSLDQVSRAGTTSTSQTLKSQGLFGAGGYIAGLPLQSALPGSANAMREAAKVIGSMISSPAGVGKYLQGKTAVRRGIDNMGLGDIVRKAGENKTAIYQSVWPLMQGDQQ